MKTKDGDSRTGLFKSTWTPGGVLLSKTVVDGDKDGGFWVKAVNLSDENVMLFKNQKVGNLTDIVALLCLTFQMICIKGTLKTSVLTCRAVT